MKFSDHKIIWLTVIGSGLEYFDFTIYALFAHYISLNFFPQNNAFIALMNTFTIFAIGYLARPLGAIILGHIGDKYGRKHAFTYAILVMATATLLIGCLPSYNIIGIAAPILLVLLRLIQGVSLGGEVGGAITFTLEHYENKRKGMMQAFVIVGMCFSGTIAGIIGYILTHFLSSQQMAQWGWRLPFIFGFFLGLIGYTLRRQCLETPAFLTVLKENTTEKIPFITLSRQYPREMLRGFCLAVMSACITSFFLFSPTYLSMHATFPSNAGFAVSSAGFLSLGLTSLLAGTISDRLDYKYLFIISGLLTILVGYPVFHLIIGLPAYTVATLPIVSGAIILVAITVGISNGIYAIAIADQFPTKVRYSGIGFCQNLSFALVGGTAPLIFTSLIKITGNLMAPYYYLVACAIVMLIAALSYKRLSSFGASKKSLISQE